MTRREISIVEYYSERCGDRCGYCKSRSSFVCCGMWAHSLNAGEYQRLIDRGWRRSGHYLYKPRMKQTCCPTYTIRCDVGDLQMSKSQRKVLKKFYNYLRFGDAPKDSQSGEISGSISIEGEVSADCMPSLMEHVTSQPAAIELDKIEMDLSSINEGQSSSDKLGSSIMVGDMKDPNDPVAVNIPSTSTEKRGTEVEPGEYPRQRKAKLIRLERKYNKLRRRGVTETEAIKLTYETKKANPEKKPFEDYFPRPEDMSNFTHKLRVELYPVSQLEMNHTMLQETHRLYVKYQVAVHGDSPEDCTIRQFKEFLVESPLYDSHSNQAPVSGFGSFHQQYWLDEKLVAVGVIDILPKCVSSVYFFYDPDLRFLTWGTYGALQEMNYTRGLKKVCPTIKFYYLGYYIHSCPKMKYKGKYCPSYLLCPETYTWHRIEKCLLMLEKNKYSRFEAKASVADKHGVVNLEKVMILHKHQAMGFLKYKQINPGARDEDRVTEYATLVGDQCYQRLLLYRS